ncbi:cell division protein FtsX [Patescibacteria group bacterium]
MLAYIRKIFFNAAQNFARNFWLVILTISILILLLLSINVLIMLNFLTDEASKQVQKRVDVSIYLKPGVSDEEAKSLRSYLMGLPSVAAVQHTSSENVLEEFKERHKNDEDILSSLALLDQNPFGGVLVVETVKIDDYKIVLKQLESAVYKDIIENKDFSDHERLVGVITRLTSFIKQLIIIVSGIFALIAMVIVFNTIKIAIYTHREEIAIMKLVGASNWRIRAPYIAEVALYYSLIATVVTFILIFPIISLFQPKVLEFFQGEAGDIFAYYRANFFSLFGIQFLIVAILCAVSAGLAIGKYLKK